MQAILQSLTDAQWANAEHTAINCIIQTSQFGDQQIPFTACETDVEQHGRQIFASIVSGAYGPIAEYIAPPAPAPFPIRE
jgi:hypothetical protein